MQTHSTFVLLHTLIDVIIKHNDL